MVTRSRTMQGSTTKDFTGSKVWQEGHKLVLTTYRFLRAFPAEEQFSLKNQMQKAAVTITTNIAESHSAGSTNEKLEFLVVANASMIEFQNCLLISRDVGYLKTAYFDEIARQTAVVSKQLSALTTATQKLV